MANTPHIIDRSDSILVASFPASGAGFYITTFAAGVVQACTCKGWRLRCDCKHAAALTLLAQDLGDAAARSPRAEQAPQAHPLRGREQARRAGMSARTEERIEMLADEAWHEGDMALVELCKRALGGDMSPSGRLESDQATAECLRNLRTRNAS